MLSNSSVKNNVKYYFLKIKTRSQIVSPVLLSSHIENKASKKN